jgi:hypothetical protein
MPGVLVIMNASGEYSVQPCDNPPCLIDLQAAVGGDIEIVPGFNRFRNSPAAAYCHETGKADGLPVNVAATDLWRQQCATTDVLVGPVVVLIGDRDFIGLTP